MDSATEVPNPENASKLFAIILTTGEILPKARAGLVDLVHEPIRFVDGKTLCTWINESFSEELDEQLRQAGRLPEEEVEEDEPDLAPVEAVASYLRETCPEEIEDIESTLATLDPLKRKIVRALMSLRYIKNLPHCQAHR
jgi:hypothetical protein